MTPPPSFEAIDKAADAIYKLCNLRNSTALSIANASWNELELLDSRKEFTFNSIVNTNPKQVILSLGQGCKETSPIGHLESSLDSLRALVRDADQALSMCISSMWRFRSKISTKRDLIVRTNGLASLPDNVLFRIFTFVPCDELHTVRLLFRASLLCRRLRPIIAKVAKTWTTVHLPAVPRVILGVLKFAPNAELCLDGKSTSTYRHASPESEILELVSHQSFWSSFANLKTLDNVWLENFALLKMKDLEKHLPKEFRGSKELHIKVIDTSDYFQPIRKLSEKELLVLDVLFQQGIDYPNLSDISVIRGVPGNLPQNITGLTVTLHNNDDQNLATKLLDTLKKAPKLAHFNFSYDIYDTHSPLDDVSTTVVLPSLTTMFLSMERGGLVDGIARFLRLFQLPKLESLYITYTVRGKSTDVVEERLTRRDGDDILVVTKTDSQYVHFTILEKSSHLPQLKVFSLTVHVTIPLPRKQESWPCARGRKLIAQKSVRYSTPRDPRLFLLPIWVDIPFENIPGVRRIELSFEDDSAFVHLPRKLRLPLTLETLSFTGIRGLQWKGLSEFLKKLKKTREWENFRSLDINGCEDIDKNVEKLRSLVTKKHFTYCASTGRMDPIELLL
ncbi:hypothetical protein SCHPADRAFT_992025 [Schizopora paradoxa]|uniref:F-box domain-containing protein n=1 Tax=Schizopora paradoxa TaxID=27342 RepID=A0A0H2S8V4_9AGAM|nr:hypothetical protein SCHPADRAFT_992025 [Schizopora paradoxa]